MKNKVLSLIITLALLLGFIPNLSMAYSENDNEYSDVVEIESNETTEIDGQIYKVFEISNLKVNDLLKSARSYGEFKPMAAGDKLLNWQLQVDWIGRGESEFPFPAGGMEVTLMQTGTSKVFGKVVYTKDKINMSTGIGTPVDFLEVENVNPDELGDSVKLGIPDSVNYDAKVFLEGTPKKGYKISALFKQQVNPLFKSEWHITDADKPSIDAYVIDTNDDTKTMDFYVPKNDNEIYSIYDTPFAKYYDGSSFKPVVTGTDARKSKNENYRGAFGKNNILLGNAAEPSIVFGYGESENHNKTGFVNVNNKKYLLNVFGDHLTIKCFAVYEALNVKLNSGAGKVGTEANKDLNVGGKATQEIGHSEMIKDNESGREISFATDENVVVPKVKVAGKDVDTTFAGWATSPQTLTDGKLSDINGHLVKADGSLTNDGKTFKFTEKETTLYAVFTAPQEGKVTIQYVDGSGDAIKDKYKIAGKDYPSEAKGNVGENVDASSIPQPKFIGYERNGNIDVTNKKYLENGGQTVEVPYKKLDDIIPEDKATQDVKDTYKKVTIKVDGSKGKFKQDNAEKTETSFTYYVNPVENKSLKDVLDFSKLTAESKDVAVDKIDTQNPWKFTPDKTKEDTPVDVALTTKVTKANFKDVDVVMEVKFIKEQGTVKYEYAYDKTGIDPAPADPTNVPDKPEDVTKDVGETVTVDNTKPDKKKLEVKDPTNKFVIANWEFQGWKVNNAVVTEVTVVKAGVTIKGTWKYVPVTTKKVTSRFVDESGNGLPALSGEFNKFPQITQDAKQYYPGQNADVPAQITDSVKGTKGNEKGTWTFDGWYPEKLSAKKNTALTVKAQGTNEYLGKWVFAKEDTKTVTFSFVFYNSKDLTKKIEQSVLKGRFEPDVPKAQTGKYVDDQINLPSFNDVEIKKGDLQGTWKFDGWYKSTDTNFENKLKDANAKVSETDAENKLVGKWILTETATKVVTRVFVIDSNIMGDGKDVPTGYALPQGVKDQKPNDTENYIGSKQTPGKDKFNAVEEKIGEKIGNWTFVKWDKNELIVAENPGADDNKFTGTWTWTQATSDKPTVDQPKADDTVIKGKGKKGSTIVVTTPDGKTHTTTVGDNGDWSVTVPPVKEGDKIKVTQEEKGKKKSGEVEVTVERKIKYFGHFYEPSPDYLNKNVPAKKEEKVQEKYFEAFRWYVKGNDMGMFMPKKGITRAEVAQMFARALEYDKAMINVNITPYTDVDANAWYYEAVQKTSAAGIFKGSDKGTFMPTREITKAELIATIARFQHLSTKAGNTLNLQANHWATSEVEAAYQEGWLDIYTNGTAQFAADEVISREEVVTILNRAFGRIADTKYIDDNAHTMTNFPDATKDMWSYYEIMTAANTYLVDKMWVNHATKDNGPETLKEMIEWVKPLIDNKDVREVVEQVRFQR